MLSNPAGINRINALHCLFSNFIINLIFWSRLKVTWRIQFRTISFQEIPSYMNFKLNFIKDLKQFISKNEDVSLLYNSYLKCEANK